MISAEFAAIYDRFNDHQVYEEWLDFTLGSLAKKPSRYLDLACGTGEFTQLMAPFVDHAIGLDLDAKMIEFAQQRDNHKDNLQFVQGDMTAFAQEYGDYDLITCYLDSLCFLSDFTEVAKVLQEVYASLQAEGIFLFDVWTPEQICEGFADFHYADQDQTSALIWQSQVEVETLTVEHHLSFFSKEANSNLYQRKETTIRERSYPLELYLQGLLDAGFARIDIEVYRDSQAEAYQAGEFSERWFFRCQKA